MKRAQARQLANAILPLINNVVIDVNNNIIDVNNTGIIIYSLNPNVSNNPKP